MRSVFVDHTIGDLDISKHYEMQVNFHKYLIFGVFPTHLPIKCINLRVGDPAGSTPYIKVIVRWKWNRGLSWLQLGDCARFINIIWNNIPHIPTAPQRIGEALRAWSSWSMWREDDSDWSIIWQDEDIHIIIARKSFEAGAVVRGLEAFRANLLPEDDAEHYDGRCYLLCNNSTRSGLLERKCQPYYVFSFTMVT